VYSAKEGWPIFERMLPHAMLRENKRISDSAVRCQLGNKVTAAEQHKGNSANACDADSANGQCGRAARRPFRMGADRPHLLTRAIYMIAPRSWVSVAGAPCKSASLDREQATTNKNKY